MDVAFFLGFLKAFLLLPKIFVFRRKNRKLFVKKDREVIQDLAGE